MELVSSYIVIITKLNLIICFCAAQTPFQGCLQPAAGVEIPIVDAGSCILPNSTQAIITSYRFNCCGTIESWEAAVHPDGGGHRDGGHTIHFQVWRPSPTVEIDGCYSLVGENRFTSITLNTDDLVSETPEPSNIISVRPGDVVGYYTITNGNNPDEGIQLNDDDVLFSTETVWYHTGTDEALMFRGEMCPFPVSASSNSGFLTQSTDFGPIVSANIRT